MINILRPRIPSGTYELGYWRITPILILIVCYTHALAVSPEGRLEDAGIRKLQSKHLTLFTDLAPQPAIDELPAVFDLAVPEWSRFFGFDAKLLDNWHVVACVINSKDRFRQHGLLPADLPEFLHGFQLVDEIWIYEQPSDYYRRHLLLHEGTHAVMNRVFGRVGPAWYREGIAELVGTHEYADGKLELARFPKDKLNVEYWGRIRIVKEQVREGKSRSIQSIVTAPSRAFLNVESYAWSWALQAFGYEHPSLGQSFNELQQEMLRSTDGVTHKFLRSYQANQREFDSAWHLFLHHLDYGYDPRKESVVHANALVPLREKIATASVDAARGWQSTGLVVPPDSSLDIAAEGRFRVAQDSQTWWCEPQGVTIEYYQRRPLGELLASVVNPQAADGSEAFTRPIPIGRRGQVSTKDGGILYLRINERADKLADNQGKIAVNVKLMSPGL